MDYDALYETWTALVDRSTESEDAMIDLIDWQASFEGQCLATYMRGMV